MTIALIICILGGVLLNIFGNIARTIRKNVTEMRNQLSDVTVEARARNKWWKIIAFELIVRLFLIIFFPLALAILIIDHFRGVKDNESFVPWYKKEMEEELKKKMEEKKKALIENRSYLYFKDTHGGGLIKCHGCDFTNQIISSTHGFNNPSTYTIGYQCQSCGEYQTVSFLGNKRVSPEICSCGGVLSNGKPLFCPRCRSRDVSFINEFVT